MNSIELDPISKLCYFLIILINIRRIYGDGTNHSYILFSDFPLRKLDLTSDNK